MCMIAFMTFVRFQKIVKVTMKFFITSMFNFVAVHHCSSATMETLSAAKDNQSK